MCYSALVERQIKYLERKFGILVRTDFFNEYEERSQSNSKQFPPLEDRIFPHHYAPVIFEKDGVRQVDLMRYSVFPPPHLAGQRKFDAVFNARRDNLTSPFWKDAFMRNHGFVAVKAFYEWVAVSDLLKADVVTIEQVKEEFEKQTSERKVKVESAGKRYKPTATELKDPTLRQVIIEFRPQEDMEPMLVPVVFTEQVQKDGTVLRGFAIVTDEPPPEVSAAGHDRCPVFLQSDRLNEWLFPEQSTPRRMVELLGDQRKVAFAHSLIDVA